MSIQADLLLLKIGTFEEKKEAGNRLKGSHFSADDYRVWDILNINFSNATIMGESLKDMTQEKRYEMVDLLQGGTL